MAFLSKRQADSPSVKAAIPGRLLLVAAATALVAVSLLAFKGRASARVPEVSIVADTSIVYVCSDEQRARPRVQLEAAGIAPTCEASYLRAL